MIGKVGSQPATEYVQIERSIKEPGPQIKEDVVYERPSRESAEQTANARKNEMAITGSTQKAILDSQIQPPVKQTAVAAKQLEPASDSSSLKTLKVGDNSYEVTELKGGLEQWEFQNNLRTTPANKDSLYTEDTEKAVRRFQSANNLPQTGKADPTTQQRLKLENNRNFQTLDNEVKQNIRATLSLYSDQPAAQENLLKLVTDRQFTHLISKDAQKAALSGLLMHPVDKDHLKNVNEAIIDVAILEKQKALDHLPESTKRQVINTIFKKTETKPAEFVYSSEAAREMVINLAKSPQFAALSESQQQKMMDAVAANPSFTATDMQRIISSSAFNGMNEKMKAHVIDLAYENTMYPVNYGAKNPSDYYDRVQKLSELIQSSKFQQASEDDKWAQLNAFKTSPPKPKNDLNIL